MKYKNSKLRLNEIASAMQVFYISLKFGLVTIYVLTAYRKKSSSMFECWIHCLHFSLENTCTSILKNGLIENLETTPLFSRNVLLRSIYLQLLIIGVVFLHYTIRVLSVFFFFLSFFYFFIFLSVFSLTDTNDSREGRGNHYFSCFLLPLSHKYSFSSSWFLPLLFHRSICNYQTNRWWDLFS